MTTHFITYRPNSDRAKPDTHDRYDDFLSWKEFGYIEGWSARKTFQPGDLAIFYMAASISSLVGVGIVDSEPYYKEIKNPADFKNPVFCDFNPVWFLDNLVPIKEAIEHRKLENWWRKKPYQGICRIDSSVAQALIEEIIVANPSMEEQLEQVLSLPGTSVQTSIRKYSSAVSTRKQWEIQDLLNLSWIEFEYLVSEVFKSKGNAKVELTSPTVDYGVDVVITKKPFSTTEIVQCKRYRPSAKVSCPDMQKFVGAMTKFKAKKGYFVTTSTFSRYAIDFVEGMKIELVDGRQLLQMITEIDGFPSPTEFEMKS